MKETSARDSIVRKYFDIGSIHRRYAAFGREESSVKTWKLCLLSLVPGVLGWLLNRLLSWVLFASLPDFLYTLLFYLVYYLPTGVTIIFCLKLGRRCGRARVPFPKYLLCTQWPSVASLVLYVWQFLFVSDATRSTLLAVLGQMPSAPLMFFATRLTWLLDTDNTWDRPESLLATIFSLVLLALLYIAGYWWGRRKQSIEDAEMARCTQ